MSTKKKQGLLLTFAIVLILAGVFQQNLGNWGNNMLSYIFPPSSSGGNATQKPGGTAPAGTFDPNATGNPVGSKDPAATNAPTGQSTASSSSEEPVDSDPSSSAVEAGVKPVQTNNTGNNDYFSKERLARDSSRGRMKEELENITKDSNASNEVKNNAYESIMGLTKRSEAEQKIEVLVEQKGFVDCFACYSENGEIDIVVKADQLVSEDVAKIADIVSRHGDVTIDKIHVKSVK
jgi:hypothetical protein